MPLPSLICVAVTLLSAAVSFGYAVDGLRTAAPESRVASLYALSRSTALLAVAVTALFLGAPAFVAAVAVAMILVQGLDAVVGRTKKNLLKTAGPAVTAVLNAAALVWMLTV